MTSDEAVRRLKAFKRGKPVSNGATLRIKRLPDSQVLILCFVRMGGESSPWGVAFGRPGKKPTILTTPEPRTRDDVAEMMVKLAPELLTHLHHPRFSPFGPSPDTKVPPFQVWVPNPSHLEMLHHLAYAYTFTRFGAPSRAQTLNYLGHACGWLFRESQRPGQMVTFAATDALTEAFTFPAEKTRQGHLGFLLAWLETKGSRQARETAAAEAERQSVSTSLDPALERDELQSWVEEFGPARTAGDDAVVARATRRIHAVLKEELERRFSLTERALAVLAADSRRENFGVEVLAKASLDEHRLQYRRIEQQIDDNEDGPAFRPSPETDRYPSAAGSRFYVHEASEELRDQLLVHDDRELLAELIGTGQAIGGTITDVRDEGVGKKTVPVWVVESDAGLPLRIREDSTLCVVGLRSREVRVRSIERRKEGGYRFELVVTKLITKPHADGANVLPATSASLRGKRVQLVKPSMDQIARRRSGLIWKRDVPGAWLTHRVPKVPEADLPDGVAEDLSSIDKGQR